MAFYLIDYENTKNLAGVDKLSQNDTVVIFYSKNANSLSFEAHIELKTTQANVEYKFVEVGKNNALDFQLSSYLGYLLCKNANAEFFVISKDNGYAALLSFWKDAKLKQFVDIAGACQSGATTVETATVQQVVEEQSHIAATTEKTSSEKVSTMESELKKALALSDDEITSICKVVKQYKTKTSINNNLQKQLKDNGKVKQILNTIKPFIKDKK